MTAISFLGGVALSALAVGPLVAAAVVARRRWLPSWSGVHARVAECVSVVGALSVTTEALGVVGLFRRWVVVAGCVVVGVVVLVVAQRGTHAVPRLHDGEPGDGEPGDGAPLGSLGEWFKPATVLAALGAGVVGTQWLAASVHNLRVGMQSSFDTLWYHGPMAANFVQDASITHIHYFDDNPITAFFPGGSEVLHASGILFFGDDVLSPLLNLGFLALAVLAAWSIGRSLGSAPASVLGVLLVIGTPVLVQQQPGGGYNDVVGIALLLAAVALLLRGGARGPALVLAGVAGGLAVGTKFTMLVPVGVLALGVVLVAGRGRRIKVLATWVVAIGATGGVWFVRNLVVAGNPLPGLSFSLGPLSLAALPTTTPIDSVAGHLTNWSFVRDVFIPGWSETMGPGWWATIAGGLFGGLLVAIRGRVVAARVAGAAAVVAFAAFLVSPQYLPNIAIFFSTNARYAFPAFALGLVVLPALPALRTSIGARLLVVALFLVLVLTELRFRELWMPEARDVVVAVALLGAGAGAAACISVVGRQGSRGYVLATVVATLVVATAVTWFLQRDYRANRYHDSVNNTAAIATLRDKRDVRIAEVGIVLKYPLYGRDLSNHVVYIGRRSAHGSFIPFTSCIAWKKFLNRGHYDFLLVAEAVGSLFHPPREFAWAASDAVLHPIARNGTDATTFKVDGRLDPGTCP